VTLTFYISATDSGTGTKLKVGGTHLAQSAGNFCGFFAALRIQSVVYERFHDGQYSLASVLFAVLLLTVLPCPAICKSGGRASPCPMESVPLVGDRNHSDQILKICR